MSGPFQFGMPFPIDPDDPDVKAAMLRQQQEQENAEIKSLEFKEAFGRLLLKLDKDELNILGNIFASIRHPQATLYFGILNGISLTKYDTCPICGEDHSAELHDKMDEGLKALTGGSNDRPFFPTPTSEPLEELETTVDQMAGQRELALTPEMAVKANVAMLEYNYREPSEEEMDEIRNLAWQPPERPLPQHMEEMALQYGVEDAWEQLPGDGQEILKFVGWSCNNCGKLYASLQDRMLRAPGMEGCTGCHLMSAHGGRQGPERV